MDFEVSGAQLIQIHAEKSQRAWVLPSVIDQETDRLVTSLVACFESTGCQLSFLNTYKLPRPKRYWVVLL